jgi:quinolinate synthase
MFRISPNHQLWALDGLVDGDVRNQNVVPEPTRSFAKVALERMLESV